MIREKFQKHKKETEEVLSIEDIRAQVHRCQPDCQTGLTERDVQERIEAGWTNLPVDSAAKTTKDIMIENIFTYFNLIFFVLGILLCAVQSFKNLTFLPVIVVNTIIGIVQEIRAKNVLEKMNMLNAPQTKVVREGKQKLVPSKDLVIDDIVMFKAGNQICADAVVVEGEILVNESLLTGESDEIAKKKGDSLLSGSFVVSGQCYARLEQVGADSYISKLTLEAKAMGKGEQSEMVRSLNRLVKWAGIVIIPIGILLFVQSYYFNHVDIQESIVSMEAAVVGMIPEGLYLLTTMALVVSTIRLAKRQVLLHDMKSIETLARVNVLCVDKTGTITENKMTVQEVIETEEYFAEETYPLLSHMLGDFCAAMSSDNITMEAMKAYFTENTGKKPISKTAFTSVVKYSSVTFADGAYVLGAPEMILREDYIRFQGQIQAYSQRGCRVLVFGLYHGVIDGKALTGKVTPLGFVLLANPIREKAKETFQYFAEQGVEIKVISGDNPVTVSEVAIQAGIYGAENYIDATELESHEEMMDALKRYTVFGRVTPEQKKAFVEVLQEAGNTVAMTGDGVNDILAMKEADCSIAMASGNDAAAQAAQVVLVESDFSCMPSVVLEGRRVVNNIQRSASLFLVKNIFSLLMALFSVIFTITYPLEPSQLTLISMFTIGIPSFFLALEPNKSRIEGNFLKNVLLKALPGGLTDFFAVGALVVCGQVFLLPNEDIATAATMLLVIIGFMVLGKISWPMNRYRLVVFVGNVLALAFCGIFLSYLFSLNGMSQICVLLFVVFSFAAESAFRYLSLGVEKVQNMSFDLKNIFWKKEKTNQEE